MTFLFSSPKLFSQLFFFSKIKLSSLFIQFISEEPTQPYSHDGISAALTFRFITNNYSGPQREKKKKKKEPNGRVLK